MLFRMFAIESNRVGKRRQKLMFIDVKKAHVNPDCEYDNIYVKLPAEANAPGKCGRLLRWLYGMRGAAQSWEAHYTEKLRQEGFEAGQSAPTVFFNKAAGTRVVVHGDDFTFLGFEDELKRMAAKMAEWYEIKMRGIVGTEEGDEKSMVILNREIRVTEEGLVYKADPKHARIIKEEMGLDDDSKGVRSPTWRDTSG